MSDRGQPNYGTRATCLGGLCRCGFFSIRRSTKARYQGQQVSAGTAAGLCGCPFAASQVRMPLWRGVYDRVFAQSLPRPAGSNHLLLEVSR